MIPLKAFAQATRPILGRCVSRWAPKRTAVSDLHDAATRRARQHASLAYSSHRRKHQYPHQKKMRPQHTTTCLTTHAHPHRTLSTEPTTASPASNHNKSPSNAVAAADSTTTVKPPYTPPTTGLVSLLPAPLIPFAELSRLAAPAGTLYLLAPCIFSTLLAGAIVAPPASPYDILTTTTLFALGAFAMRGAGCTVNDLWDARLDRAVARTRLRPLARRAVSAPAALAWAAAQSLAGLAVLLRFPPPAIAAAVPALVLVALYPLAKRVTSYPQFVLGLAFSWGALLGLPALGVDLFPPLTHALTVVCATVGVDPATAATTATTTQQVPEGALASTAALYASCILWTLLYDTIYAFQDIRDDVRAGIKSSAVAQAAAPKRFLAALGFAQVATLGAVGLAAGLGPAFYVGTCGGAAVTLGVMVRRVRLGDVADCAAWFRRGAWFTGCGIGAGFLAEWGVRAWGDEEELMVEKE